MKSTSPKQRVIISVTLFGLVFIAGVLTIFFVELPRLHTIRASIDSQRITMTILREKQSNVQALQQEAHTIATAQERLNQEIWSFATEDAFYSQMTDVATKNAVTIDDPKLSDATPGTRVITRNLTLTFHGKKAPVLAALASLQAQQPLVAIQSIGLSGPAENMVLVVTAQTLWQ